MTKNSIFIFLLILIFLFEISAFYLKIRPVSPRRSESVGGLHHSPALPRQSDSVGGPTLTPIIESTLSFSPDTINTNIGQENEVDIKIDTQDKYPSLVQLELAYDPTIITGVALTPGTLFQNPVVLLNNNDKKTGRISYAIGLPENQNPQLLSGTVAKLSFTLTGSPTLSQTSIYFLPKTSIHSQNSDIPLKIAYGLKINLISSTPPLPK